MKLSFRRFETVPLIATFIVVLVTMGLGIWQLQRLEEKNRLITAIDAAQSAAPQNLAAIPQEALTTLEWHNIVTEGRFLHRHELYATPRYLKGLLGYAVLTPLEFMTPQGPRYVMVNRGWVPPEHKDSAKRMAGNPPGEVRVEGVIRKQMPKKYFTPENRPAENLWFWYDLPAMAKETGLPLLPVLIDETTLNAPGETLENAPIPFPIEITLRNDHKGYAITWFMIGLGAIGVFLAYHWEPKKPSA